MRVPQVVFFPSFHRRLGISRHCIGSLFHGSGVNEKTRLQFAALLDTSSCALVVYGLQIVEENLIFNGATGFFKLWCVVNTL